ncbi:Protein IMPACT-A like [Actinidia chinensis var. chinensis]|uniref:Protein IMPACT-A like n=1 Tax=Actinidia chinensis var. chinensis TaxID=1590841 RepID=A0A2R6PE61_ACTCC|nr:Protein IMPACT-A like [Actinidia chinensis var. chinensis]
MKGTTLPLLVLLLCFSHLIYSNAVPITRTRSLMHKPQGYGVSENTHLEKMEGERIVRRMGVELNDYPSSGANNRHTPNPKP